MSKRANPAMTGAFVLGAVGLVIAGILIFGSGELLKTKYTYVMYFQGSVSGLAVGAPVEFRGVKVGSVQEAFATVDPKDLEIRIPVVVEFVQGSLHRLGAEAQDSSANIARLVELGMRAQLQVQSLLTGQQMIALDIHEDVESATVAIDADTGHPEIPTIPTTIQEFAETARQVLHTLEKVPFDEIFADAQSTLSGIEQLVNSPEVKRALVNTNRLLIEARDAVSIGAEGSPIRYELQQTLRELAEAARSLRDFADYLERHPEALVRGKGGSQ